MNTVAAAVTRVIEDAIEIAVVIVVAIAVAYSWEPEGRPSVKLAQQAR